MRTRSPGHAVARMVARMVARSRGRATSAPDAGVAEFTWMLPMVLSTTLLAWEAFLIGMSMTYAGHAANEGARIAAVGGDYDQVREAAVQRISGAWADEKNIEVRYPAGSSCDGTGERDPDCGYVRVSIKPPLVLPGLILPTSVSARTKVVYEKEEE